MADLVAVGLVAATVAWHNGLQLAPGRWRDPVVAAGVGAAAAVGATWLWTTAEPTRGLVAAWPWTVAAAATAGAAVWAGHRWAPLAAVLSDQRIARMAGIEFALHAMLRIPVLTAFAEEVLFRGVAWVLLARLGGDTVAWLGTSAAFALGHVVVARDQARREGHPVGRWIGVTLLATGLAGLGLGWLRLSTGGIWASLGVHAVANMVLSVGARRLTEPRPAEADPAA